jgi:cytochrome c-type biogenesis protein CcmH/NrfG
MSDQKVSEETGSSEKEKEKGKAKKRQLRIILFLLMLAALTVSISLWIQVRSLQRRLTDLQDMFELQLSTTKTLAMNLGKL